MEGNIFTSHFTKLASLVTAFGALATPIVVITAYGINLKNDFEAAKVRVVQLETQLDEIRKRVSGENFGVGRGSKGDVGAEGPRGPIGQRGPQGDPGPQGPRGDVGQVIDKAEIERLVRTVVDARLQGVKLSAAAAPATVANMKAFDTSGCMPLSEYKSAKTYVARIGLEICDDDGKVLAKIIDVYQNSLSGVNFSTPGDGWFRCYYGKSCSFKWDRGRRFFVERFTGEDKKMVAQIRIEEN